VDAQVRRGFADGCPLLWLDYAILEFAGQRSKNPRTQEEEEEEEINRLPWLGQSGRAAAGCACTAAALRC
jgi:hypothetical protein